MAVAFSSWNVYLAPFIYFDKIHRDEMLEEDGYEVNYSTKYAKTKKIKMKYNKRDMYDIKQSVQNLIFALNSNSRLGSEPVFSNFTLDFKVMKPMQQQPIIIAGKEHDFFTYGEFQEEANILIDVFAELMLKGDGIGKMHAYPVPTFNIGKNMDYEEPMYQKVFEMAAKDGTPYFGNFVNSTLDEEDIKSMAILASQTVIYKKEDGRISSNEIRNLVKIWNESKNQKPKYKILMNGEFIDIIDMFKVPYENYDKYVKFTLDNNYQQLFSVDHETMILRNEKFVEERSQNVTVNDSFLISLKGFEGNVGNFQTGQIIGYYLGDGWKTNNDTSIVFAININKIEVKENIKKYFEDFGCEVIIKEQTDVSIFKITVLGKQACKLIENFIDGNSAKTKRIKCSVWNTTMEFRNGILDGLLKTDGHIERKILTHTTNKELTDDLITLANSVGKILKFRINDKNTRYFKKDKSDLETFTSYELKFIDNFKKYIYEGNEYAIIPIKSVDLISSKKAKNVYNFTVNTKDHLYELPNGIITHQCCRLQLDKRELRKKMGGLFGAGEKTGSIGVFTINLPAIGFRNKGKEKMHFFEDLKEKMLIGKKQLIIKKHTIVKEFEKGLYPALKEYLDNFNTMFMTIGFVGAHEMCKNYLDKGIETTEGRDFTIEVVNFMKEQIADFQEETGELFNLEYTPAESAAYRMAKCDRHRYGSQIAQAGINNKYYTNSTHLPVNIDWTYKQIYEHQNGLLDLATGG